MIIAIRQGDATTITETITSGLTSLSGYSAKLYIKKVDDTAIDSVTGTILGLVITYNVLNAATKLYPLGTHKFETKLFDANGHVYTPHYDVFLVEPALVNNPS